MIVSSFDIFDTCLVRKCGTPESLPDLLSLRAFIDAVPGEVRQEFVAERYLVQKRIYKASMTLSDIWDSFAWSHPLLRSKSELIAIEMQLERDLLVPVPAILEQVNQCRRKGHRILFISDMYLPSAFLKEVLSRYDFYKQGDGLYVSCECDAEKWTGELFRYVSKHEVLSFRNWTHYGDNYSADVLAPKRLGIKVIPVCHDYTPLQLKWCRQDCSLRYPYADVMAGLGRAMVLNNSTDIDAHFVCDIIAPFYASMLYRMMADAHSKGIRRLYFCARDTYMLYQMAQEYAPLFPDLSIHFLYISKQALYHGNELAKEKYFLQVGLATRDCKVAIVDIHSSGKTLVVLNQWMREHNYSQVRGYYYMMYVRGDNQYHPTNYYAEANAINIGRVSRKSTLSANFIMELQEHFVGINNLRRTIDYAIDGDSANPVFASDNIVDAEETHSVIVKNKDIRVAAHERMLVDYAKAWVELQLYRYADEIFASIAIPSLYNFLSQPDECYLRPLYEIEYIDNNASKKHRQFVKHCSFIELLVTHGRNTIWRHATKYVSIPHWMQQNRIAARLFRL